MIAPPVTIGIHKVLSHNVRVCNWSPKTRIRVIVRYNKVHHHTVKGWSHEQPRSLCTLNGGTYNTTSYIPSGNVWAMGRRIRYNTPDAPAVGFTHNHVYFGYRNARRHGAVNIMNGLAMLIVKGHPLTSHNDAPWTTPAQFNCGPRGSDGWYGCFRSCIVQYSTGHYGMVEISLASMPLAARILKRMHVVNAITFDSGGAAAMYANNRLFGSTAGTSWHRLLPDSIIVQKIRL